MANRNGIKLTPELLKSHIAEVIYEDREVGGHRVMHCHFRMDLGFMVYGKKPSTSIDPANFDVELGKQASYNNTFAQLWELEAYRALVEQDALDKATQSFAIDIQQYEVERGPISEMRSTDFISGQGQGIMFRHPRDPLRGFVAQFVRTDNERYDESQNASSREEVKNYLRSFMTVEDMNSDLVVRIAKVCYAAYVGVTDDERNWSDLKEPERQRICEQVKGLLLQPVGGLDTSLTINDRMFKSIVDSFK